MMKKIAFFLTIFGCFAWSQVSPGVLVADQNTGRIGSLAIPLKTRTLQLASALNPLFLKIRLEKGLSLRDTLVDVESGSPSEPITLSSLCMVSFWSPYRFATVSTNCALACR